MIFLNKFLMIENNDFKLYQRSEEHTSELQSPC